MRVLFWGTPEFATASLLALIGEGFDVCGVVTQPDRAQGRSRSTLVPPPVKVIAENEKIPVFQPARPRGDDFVASLAALEPDLSIVVAYGHILSRTLIDLPARGTLNVHASLLPALRGAAPIQAAIRYGLAETGVTIMRLVEALDAGPMLLQRSVPILPDATYGELQLELAELGAQTLVEALALIEAGAAAEEGQDDSRATYAPKVTRESARIDWTQSADEIARVIRAYDPKPGAWTTLRGVETRLFGARTVTGKGGSPGEVLDISKAGMLVGAGSEAVLVVVAQPAGKKRLAPHEMAGGRQLAIGEKLG
ncbi:MAG TPA: methionyl-tRNA formyltransferase [Gemmatimonadaceae bacterium]|nr:methionyl-tRNA formyltransferase [Gemmatimonadaceae bacterium]